MTSMFLAAQAQQGGGYSMLIMMVAIFAIQNSLQEGTEIVTGGGLHGTVKKINLEKNTVDIEIARGVVVTCDKNYVFADAAAAQPTK